MTKFVLIASLIAGGLALTACDVKAANAANTIAANAIYAEQPKGDQGVSSKCAAIVNPAERRKCIQTSG